ncbi:MAG TPA: nucleotidyltransferase family protein [bacterium]|nr:nucleotidyltransferase family protein [bacterium]
MTREALVKAKREEILRIAAAHGARHVRLFGSTVRGESTENSDIDFLVDLEPGRSLLDHAAMIVELEQALGCPVDVVPERGLRPRVRDAVVRDAVPL